MSKDRLKALLDSPQILIIQLTNVVGGCKLLLTVVDGNVAVLRSVHRIVGNLIGCDVCSPYQNAKTGLPLQLLAEETTLLLHEGIIRLVTNERLKIDPSTEEKAIFENYKHISHQEQNAKYKQVRKKTILEKADEIYEGYVKKKEGNQLSKRQLRKLKKKIENHKFINSIEQEDFQTEVIEKDCNHAGNDYEHEIETEPKQQLGKRTS
ncbi:hypothetical protein GQR58_009438 [Nymphon striatum]|nr:hypothetical protein GQR58_009438 [Nymphon striatum]